MQIIRKKLNRSKVRPERKWTTEKESTYRRLVGEFESLGYSVRREELKRGPGWRVMSGSCRVIENRVVFIDSRLSPDDQVQFLSAKLFELQN